MADRASKQRASHQSDNSVASSYQLKTKNQKLPSHVQDILYDPSIEKRPLNLKRQIYGFMTEEELVENLDRQLEELPWEKCEKDRRLSVKLGLEKSSRPRRKIEVPLASPIDLTYQRYSEMLRRNKFGKIAFSGLGCFHSDSISDWIVERLDYTCQRIRYELPSDKRVLENLTPLQYLERYTRLPPDLRRRYSNLFKRHREQKTDYILFQNLYPALSTMFRGALSQQNFDVLSTTLYIKKMGQLTESQFIGLAAFTDRVYWTFYVSQGHEQDTRVYYGANRQLIECADMEFLDRKLEGLKISRQLMVLLKSLA